MNEVRRKIDQLLNIGVRPDHDLNLVRLLRQTNGLSLLFTAVAFTGVILTVIFQMPPFIIQLQIVAVFLYPFGLYMTHSGRLNLARSFAVYAFELHMFVAGFAVLNESVYGFYYSFSLVSVVLFPLIAALVETSIVLHTGVAVIQVAAFFAGARVFPDFYRTCETKAAISDPTVIAFFSALYVPIMAAVITWILVRENQRSRDLIESSKRRMEAMQAALVTSARQAGMADISIEMLHNVGNLLTSVNLSAESLQEFVRASKIEPIAQAADMLRESADDLGEFLTNDPKGAMLPRVFTETIQALETDRDRMEQEADFLLERLGMVKAVIGELEDYAVGEAETEAVDIQLVVDEARAIMRDDLERAGIAVARLPSESETSVRGQKTKLLHIVLSLLRHASEAIEALSEDERVVHISVDRDDSATRLHLSHVMMGLDDDDLEHLFNQDFATTRGRRLLHTCANYMADMGGTIETSKEDDRVLFTLVFPDV